MSGLVGTAAGLPGSARLIAPAKLTLGLRVVGVRDDGYHLIDAEMVSLDLHDVIELSPGSGTVLTGAAAATVAAGPDDLVQRALATVRVERAARVHKCIPAGAGLGGGSSDAAAVLRWGGVDDLATAVALGADVGFCLRGGRAHVSGIGDVVDRLPFEPRTVTLLTPPIHCPTPAVYRRWDELGGPRDPSGNDLTPAAIDLFPDLVRWRDDLARASGGAPVLAGSGSTWFVDGSHPGEGRVVAHTVPEGWAGPDLTEG